MADNTIAQAYVQVMPSMEGITGALSGAFTKEVNSAAKGAEGGFSVIKMALGNLVAQGLTAAANGIKNLAAGVVSTGREFEASMSQVMATMGNLDNAAPEELEKSLAGITQAAADLGIELDSTASVTDQAQTVLTAFARQMGSETAFSASEAAAALNYMALAGYDVSESVGMLPTVLDLAAAGNIDLASASDMVTDAQSALGLEMEDTAVMVDQMAKASSKSNTSVAQLGEAILKIGATARNVKGGTQELTTVLGVLADNGIKGAEGGTHLRNMLLSLQSAAEDGKVSMGDFSVEIYDADGNMRSMIDIIGEMQAGMGDMSQEARDALTSGIFNKTDLAAVNALLGTSQQRFTELGDAIANSAGAAGEMADTQLKNLEGELTIMNSAWQEFQLTLYETVNGPLTSIVHSVTTELIPAITDLVNGVDGAGEAIGTAVGNIMDTVIDTVTTLMPELLKMLVTLIEAVIMSIAEHAPAIVAAVVETIPLIVSSILGMLPTLLSAVLQIITEIINGIAVMLPQIVQTIVDIIPVLVSTLMEHLPELLDAATTLLMSIVEAIPIIIESLLIELPGIIETILNALFDALPQLLEAAVSLLMMIVEAIPTIIDALIENLPKIIDTIITTLLDHLDDIINGAITLLMGIIAAIPTIITTLVQKIPELVTTIVNTLLDHLPELIVGAVQLLMGIIQAIPQIISALIQNIPQIITTIVNSLGQGLSQIVNVGYNLITGLWEGIQSAASWLWDKLAGWASGIIDGIMGFFGVHSPSRVFAGIGEMLSAGLGEGIDDGAHFAIDAVNDMSNSIMDEIAKTELNIPDPSVVGAVSAGVTGLNTSAYNRPSYAETAGDIDGKISRLISILEEYLPGIADMDVYLDSGELVGGTAQRMNEELGRISVKAARGMA